jgi:hyaluronoglucosaminidase
MFSSETVNAHAYLANKLYDDLMAFDNRITLTLCPLQYNGKGDEYFISKLGQSIEPEISLFWTGRNICSQELTVPEAITFIQSTRHRPLYWDNFPVNDAEMYNEMHLGYIAGRDKDLYRYSEGLIANCMEFCECSKIPLLTIADYLWNPEAYEPLSSWDYAIDTVAGDRAELFKYFADNLLTSCLKVPNSPMLAQTFSLAEQELRAGDIMAALTDNQL